MNKTMIRFFILFLSTLLISSCAENQLHWQGYCLPYDKLTPASLHSGSSENSNYDSAVNHGPSLFFSGDNVSKEIPTFKAFTADPLSGKYRHNIQVYLTQTYIEKLPSDINSLRQSDLKAIYFDDLSKYHWDAYKKVNETYEFWGSCMLDGSGESKEGYSCLRQLKVNDLYLSFDLDYINLKAHKDVDVLLSKQLTSWHCN